MEAGVMRWLVVAMLLAARPASAECNLSQLIGYTLLFSKIIDGYVQDGKRVAGFGGCTPDRVLVFSDNTGVRCKEAFLQKADFPTAYLFARNANDMKLCVDGSLYDVARAN